MACRVTVHSLLHYGLHTGHQLLVSQALVKTTRQGLPIVLLETLHVLAVSHHLHPFHNLSLVVSDELEGKKEEVLEVEEDVGVSAFHQFQVVLGELEGSLLEVAVSRGAAQDEAEINVNDGIWIIAADNLARVVSFIIHSVIAKEGRLTEQSDLHIPLSHFKKLMMSKSNEIWNNRWSESKGKEQTKYWLPTISFKLQKEI